MMLPLPCAHLANLSFLRLLTLPHRPISLLPRPNLRVLPVRSLIYGWIPASLTMVDRLV